MGVTIDGVGFDTFGWGILRLCVRFICIATSSALHKASMGSGRKSAC